MGIFEEKRRQAMATRAALENYAVDNFDKVIARGEEIRKLVDAGTTAHIVKLDSVAADVAGFHASIEEYANTANEETSSNKLPKAWLPPHKMD